jgi:hypothetical protein
MRLAKHLSIAAGVIAVAISAVATTTPALADGWKHRHKHKHHHHHHYYQRDYPRYYSAPRVIYERPIVYREAPMYYAPMGPPSLNVIIPLR